jgi:hypothetical protein
MQCPSATPNRPRRPVGTLSPLYELADLLNVLRPKPEIREHRPTSVSCGPHRVDLFFACRDTLTCHFTARVNREAALRHDLFEIRHAIDDFYADKQRYPESSKHWCATTICEQCRHPLTGRSDAWIRFEAATAAV